MRCCSTGLSPGESQAPDARWKRVTCFWNELHTCGQPGATTWEVLESLENEVTECLYRNPPDIGLAESLTAQAAALIAGFIDP